MASGSLARPVAARQFASPLSRALARRHGLDLAHVSGSGPQGRIVRADVEALLGQAGPLGRGPGPDGHDAGPFDAVANSIGRQLLARRLTQSAQQAPHFYARVDCLMDALLALRAERSGGAGQAGLKLSINDFVIKAAALALREVPAVNASYTEAAVRRYRGVHIAMVVALDGGLLTPVIRDADLKGVDQIARASRDLAARARAGKLAHGECRGGTFSISNLGRQGLREFTALIDPPQAAILAVGAAEPRALVRDGQLVVATMMTVTLSVDHRVFDGAVAARWLAAFKRHLEAPREDALWEACAQAP